ncbi:MAG: hypothetical protein HN975_02035 [Anaerolineae bacterium]|jgi:hypothetical protein|nr:hypothetical protein [Anaerolineae bacterium]
MPATRITPPSEETIIKRIWRRASGTFRREVPADGVYVVVALKISRVITEAEEATLEGLIADLPLVQVAETAVILDTVPEFDEATANLVVSVACRPIAIPAPE